MSALAFSKQKYAAFLLGALVGGLSTSLLMVVFTPEVPDFEVADQPQVSRSLPVSLKISSVGIEASFGTPVGLDESGDLEVPDYYDQVAWYQPGPTPGEFGPSVVLGHVDSEAGPEVFHPLKDVSEGDLIEVTREDGSVAVFLVYEVDYYSQKNFPMAQVFGVADGAELRLVTCAGTFNKNNYRYSHNLVVYSKLQEIRSGDGG